MSNGNRPNWRQAGINVMGVIQTLILEDQKHKKKMKEIQAEFETSMKEREYITGEARKEGQLNALNSQLELTFRGIQDPRNPATMKESFLIPQAKYLYEQIKALSPTQEGGQVSPEVTIGGMPQAGGKPIGQVRETPPDYLENIKGLFEVPPEAKELSAGEKSRLAVTKGAVKRGMGKERGLIGQREEIESLAAKEDVSLYEAAHLLSLERGTDPKHYPQIIPEIEKWWEPSVKAEVQKQVNKLRTKEWKRVKLMARKRGITGRKNILNFIETELRKNLEADIRVNKPKLW